MSHTIRSVYRDRTDIGTGVRPEGIWHMAFHHDIDRPCVQYSTDSGFATVTLDTPHNGNALSSRLVKELLEELERAGNAQRVRAVILTHTGPVFGAEADANELANADPNAVAIERSLWLADVICAVLDLPKPVLAQVNGEVRGGGMGLLAACDIAVAGPRSSFAFTEVRLGTAPFLVSLAVLPRLNSAAARRYFLTGEEFDAETAEKMGLITMAADDPGAEIVYLCTKLAQCSPQGLAESKRLATAHVRAGFDRCAADMAARAGDLFGTEEAIEGTAALFEHRPARWALESRYGA